MNCDWNVFVSIQNNAKPTHERLQTLSHKSHNNVLSNKIMILLTKYNLIFFNVPTDNIRCNDQHDGTQHYYIASLSNFVLFVNPIGL